MLIPVDNVLCMEVLQPAGNFSSIEDGTFLFEAWVAHVVDVELEIAAIHQRQHQTKGVLHLECIRQIYLTKHHHNTHHHN